MKSSPMIPMSSCSRTSLPMVRMDSSSQPRAARSCGVIRDMSAPAEPRISASRRNSRLSTAWRVNPDTPRRTTAVEVTIHREDRRTRVVSRRAIFCELASTEASKRKPMMRPIQPRLMLSTGSIISRTFSLSTPILDEPAARPSSTKGNPAVMTWEIPRRRSQSRTIGCPPKYVSPSSARSPSRVRMTSARCASASASPWPLGECGAAAAVPPSVCGPPPACMPPSVRVPPSAAVPPAAGSLKTAVAPAVTPPSPAPRSDDALPPSRRPSWELACCVSPPSGAAAVAAGRKKIPSTTRRPSPDHRWLRRAR